MDLLFFFFFDSCPSSVGLTNVYNYDKITRFLSYHVHIIIKWSIYEWNDYKYSNLCNNIPGKIWSNYIFLNTLSFLIYMKLTKIITMYQIQCRWFDLYLSRNFSLVLFSVQVWSFSMNRIIWCSVTNLAIGNIQLVEVV